MPLTPRLLAVAAFLLAGAASALAGRSLVGVVEDSSREAVRAEIEAEGHLWATVLSDGLMIVLEGEAPTEADRFNAISAAGRVVDGSRVIDNLRVAPAKAIVPPDYAVEILRNDSGVSLIGLIPAAASRARLAAAIAEAAGGQPVSDLLQLADHPVPPGWQPAMDYALAALALLPRAKISVAAGRVAIEAVADSPDQQRRLEADLARAAPEGLSVALAIEAPRPVISPFALRFRLEGGVARFDACAADTEAAREAILDAAARAGMAAKTDCRLGLGAPTPLWGEAAARGIDAVAALGGGAVTFSDAEVRLVAAEGTDAQLFARVAGELERALPAVFSFAAERAVAAAPAAARPPEFVARLAAGGGVRLEGRLSDALVAATAASVARAHFGGRVSLALPIQPEGLPEGWSVRVLAGIEALSHLHDGTVTVTPDLLRVEGRTGRPSARDDIASGVLATLGPGARLEIEVVYDEALDPIAALPTPQECLAKVTAATARTKITFDPGAAILSAAGEGVVEEIAAILRACPDLRLRIAGYTDSQGRESSNLELSQARAEAVLAALRAERVPVAGFQAVGYGEADPIASNETEAGREANRRIEFSLIPDPAAAAAAARDGAAPALPPEPAEHPEEAQPLDELPQAPPSRPEGLAPAGAEGGG